MPTIWVREFKAGLDSRRLPETSEGGTLLLGQDGHITNGGEFEKRAAFVKEYTLPAGTVSLAADPAGLYVFGSAAEPSDMPADVTYQRLENGATTLLRVASYDLYAGLIYAAGVFSDGSRLHYYDGTLVSDWVDGRASATFQVLDSTPTSTIEITVDGVAITGSAVTWTDSNSNTADLIAAEINSAVSSPEYEAVAFGDYVTIIYDTATTAANGLAVAFTLGNAFAVSPELGLTLSGGIDTTFPEPGNFVKTIGSKVNTLAGAYLVGSGVGTPTNWTTATGSFFIDMSQQTSGAEDLTSLAEYQNFVAIFAERLIQIWSLAADPADNAKQQVLRNTGTASPRSVTQFGDADVFYLDESGLRSLQARDSSNAAATSDIGVAIDSLVRATLTDLTEDERLLVIGLVNPQDGRFWLIMKDVIYVLSVFPGSKVNAWTTYVPHYFDDDGNRVDFDIEDAAVFDRRVYLRSGDDIFCYGGIETGLETDDTSAMTRLPYLDAENPSKEKNWTGFDAAVSGEWAVAAGMSLRDNDEEDDVGIIYRTTYNEERVGGIGKSTHISMRFASRGSGAAKLSACAIHYEE
jgi:hypothetical protein